MVHITFDVPEGVLAALHQAQPEFTRELRLAAAVKWYERGTISQGRCGDCGPFPGRVHRCTRALRGKSIPDIRGGVGC